MDTMHISDSAQFAADPATVFSMLTDRSYLEQVCEATHALSFEAAVDGNLTRTTRTLSSPDSAARFTGPTLTVIEEITWNDGGADGARSGSINLSVPGQPVSMSGTVTLSPGGRGSLLALDAELRVAIPLLGKKLEQSAAPAVLAGFRKQEEVGAAYLGA